MSEIAHDLVERAAPKGTPFGRVGPQRKRAPETRRSYGRCHADSWQAGGSWEENWRMRPMTRRDEHQFLAAASAFDRWRKKPGDRRGPLGRIAIDVLGLMLRLARKSGGYVRTYGIKAIAKMLAVAPSTAADAMARLWEHGWLDWMRRKELVKDAPQEPGSVQVKQTFNIYFVALPKAAVRLYEKMFGPRPRKETRAAMAARVRAEADAQQRQAAFAADVGQIHARARDARNARRAAEGT